MRHITALEIRPREIVRLLCTSVDFYNLHEMDFSMGSMPSGAFGAMGVLLHQYEFNGATAAWEKAGLFYCWYTRLYCSKSFAKKGHGMKGDRSYLL